VGAMVGVIPGVGVAGRGVKVAAGVAVGSGWLATGVGTASTGLNTPRR